MYSSYTALLIWTSVNWNGKSSTEMSILGKVLSQTVLFFHSSLKVQGDCHLHTISSPALLPLQDNGSGCRTGFVWNLFVKSRPYLPMEADAFKYLDPKKSHELNCAHLSRDTGASPSTPCLRWETRSPRLSPSPSGPPGGHNCVYSAPLPAKLSGTRCSMLGYRPRKHRRMLFKPRSWSL